MKSVCFRQSVRTDVETGLDYQSKRGWAPFHNKR